MKTYKFRGEDICGHKVCGLLTKKRNRNNGELQWAIVDGNFTAGETIPVIENSIAQFVGYDATGNEVYEGDIVIQSDGDGDWTGKVEILDEPVVTDLISGLCDDFYSRKHKPRFVLKENKNGN